jgi:hypothetical protein
MMDRLSRDAKPVIRTRFATSGTSFRRDPGGNICGFGTGEAMDDSHSPHSLIATAKLRDFDIALRTLHPLGALAP